MGRSRAIAIIAILLVLVVTADTPLFGQQIPRARGVRPKNAGSMEFSLFQETRQQITRGPRAAAQRATVVIQLRGALTPSQRRALEGQEVRILRTWGTNVVGEVPYARLIAVRDLPFVRYVQQRTPAVPVQASFNFTDPVNLPQITGPQVPGSVKIAVVDYYDPADGSLTVPYYGKDLTSVVLTRRPDRDWHGNAVAEVIARMTQNYLGIGPLLLYPVGFLDEFFGIISDAVSRGADVINASLAFPNCEDFFDGSGPSTQEVARRLGDRTLLVLAAGNEGSRHYEGQFSDLDNNRWHNFEGTDETLTIDADGPLLVLLNWDSFGAPLDQMQDLDLVIYDGNLSRVVYESLGNQREGRDPRACELIRVPNARGRFHVAVRNDSVRPRAVKFHVFVEQNTSVIGAERRYLTTRTSMSGNLQPSDKFMTVGAICWPQNEICSYSSQGPTTDGRRKPDLVANAPVSSEQKGRLAGSSIAHGTSFTAPQVSAAAALVKLKNPNLSAQQVKSILMQSASGIPGLGSFDFNVYGAGILNPRRAYEIASQTRAPRVAAR